MSPVRISKRGMTDVDVVESRPRPHRNPSSIVPVHNGIPDDLSAWCESRDIERLCVLDEKNEMAVGQLQNVVVKGAGLKRNPDPTEF